ncbi:MAG: L,D-transpeptidase family protein [Chloroflexota bacterium]|nr:MAG: L,D-transpeptidase family protein [Chloroflexota bacterium]
MASEDSNVGEQSVRSTLKAAIEVAKAGRREEALQLLKQVVAADPSNAVAWFWLAGVTDQPDEARIALERIEQLDPNHPRLEAALRWTRGQDHRGNEESPESGSVSAVEPTRPVEQPVKIVPAPHPSPLAWPRRLWLGLAGLGLLLLICALVWVIWFQVDAAAQARLMAPPTPDHSERILALQPELNAAVVESRWEDAIAVLQVMRALEPDNPATMRELARVYYQLGLQRRDQGDLEGALIALDESLALDPLDLSLQRERWLVDSYRQGVLYHQAGLWRETIETLSLVRRDNPTYLDVTELLYSAYYNLGLSQQAAGDLVGAQVSYQAGVELLPEEPLAREKADEVAWLLRPPTPTPAPSPTPTPDPKQKRIVVDVSEQRMYVYEGDELRWKWIVSTGEPGRDTAIGQFAVQSKIPMAYASTWNLDMPHWLGIYWSGPLENGIHSLPIQRHTGYKLWDGFLGQRVSYGCVILSEDNAKKLYEWAKIGTPVTIQP